VREINPLVDNYQGVLDTHNLSCSPSRTNIAHRDAFAAMSKTKRRTDFLKSREQGFDMGYVSNNTVSEYNALHDPNMRHYFENRHVQQVSASFAAVGCGCVLVRLKY